MKHTSFLFTMAKLSSVFSGYKHLYFSGAIGYNHHISYEEVFDMKQYFEIVDVMGREILDSRGNPTVEVEVTLDDGTESTFGPGTILQVTGTDGKSFVDVITEDGVTGRIAITQPAGDWQWYINGEPELEYFELVPYAG